MHAIATLIDTAIPRLPIGLPLARWIATARQRRALAALDAERLADLGIAPEAARREAKRPFWDLARR